MGISEAVRILSDGARHFYRKRIGPSHRHLGAKGMPESVDANVGDSCAFACAIQTFPDIGAGEAAFMAGCG